MARGSSRLGCALAASLVLAAGVGSAQEQEPEGPPPPIVLDAHAGLMRSVERGAGWLPVEVSVSNTGPGIRADVIVSLKGRSSEPYLTTKRRVNLARGAKRREWFLLPLGTGNGQVRVALYGVPEDDDAEPPLLAEFRQDYSSYYRSPRQSGLDPAVLYVTSDPYMTWSRAAWATGAPDSGRLGVRPPSRLPVHALAYSGVDIVLLHDVDLGELSLEQRSALREWCRAGGSIMLVPRRRLAWYRDPLLKEMLGELQITQHEVTGLPRIEKRLGPLAKNAADFSRVVKPDPFTLFVARLPSKGGAQPRWGEWRSKRRRQMLGERLPDGAPFSFLQEAEFGRGAVYLLAADLSAPPFDRWRHRTSLVNSANSLMTRGVRSVLTPYVPEPRQSRSRDAANPHGDPDLVQHLDSIEMPSLPSVLLLIVVYVLCVGPINYFVLRARDRQIWIVATVPLISLLFCAGVILTGYATKGLGMVAWRVTVISTKIGEAGAVEQTGLSLRTSQAGSYPVAFDRSLAVARVMGHGEELDDGRDTVRDEGQLTYPEVSMEMWQQVTFKAQALRNLGGGLSVKFANGSVEVSNQTPYALAALLHLKAPLLGEGDPENPNRLYQLHGLGPLDSLATTVVPQGKPVLLSKAHWARETARALAPAAEETDLALLERTLLAYVPVGNPAVQELLVGLLEAPPSEIVVDGAPKADRELCLIVARGPAQ